MQVWVMASMRATCGGPGWLCRTACRATLFHSTTMVSAAAAIGPIKIAQTATRSADSQIAILVEFPVNSRSLLFQHYRYVLNGLWFQEQHSGVFFTASAKVPIAISRGRYRNTKRSGWNDKLKVTLLIRTSLYP